MPYMQYTDIADSKKCITNSNIMLLSMSLNKCSNVLCFRLGPLTRANTFLSTRNEIL